MANLWKRIAALLGFEMRIPRNDSAGCLHPCAEDSEWLCECHRRMGNDFFFLPAGRCLDDNK